MSLSQPHFDGRRRSNESDREDGCSNGFVKPNECAGVLHDPGQHEPLSARRDENNAHRQSISSPQRDVATLNVAHTPGEGEPHDLRRSSWASSCRARAVRPGIGASAVCPSRRMICEDAAPHRPRAPTAADPCRRRCRRRRAATARSRPVSVRHAAAPVVTSGAIDSGRHLPSLLRRVRNTGQSGPDSGNTQEDVRVGPAPHPDDYQAWSVCALRVDGWRFLRYRQAVIKDLTSAGRPWTDRQGSPGSGKNGAPMNSTQRSNQPKTRRSNSWRSNSWRSNSWRSNSWR